MPGGPQLLGGESGGGECDQGIMTGQNVQSRFCRMERWRLEPALTGHGRG